jgi:hypothetical protein
MECLYVGSGLVIGFVEHLQVVFTSNYSAIANSHTQQFIRAQNKSSVCCYLHRLSPGNGFQRRIFLSFPLQIRTGRRMSQN